MVAKTSQGVTTVIVGNCGISAAPLVLEDVPPPPLTLVGGQENFRFDTFAAYLGELERVGIMTNAAALIGHTTLRRRCMPTLDVPPPWRKRPQWRIRSPWRWRPAPSESRPDSTMQLALPSSTAEVKELSRVAAANGGLYVTHTPQLFRSAGGSDRGGDRDRRGDIRQAGDLASSSHGPREFRQSRSYAGEDRRSAAEPGYRPRLLPYSASSTVLMTQRCDNGVPILITWSDPYPELANAYLADIAHSWNCSEVAAAERLLPAGAVYSSSTNRTCRTWLSHPRTMIGSDGLPHDTHPHPASGERSPACLATMLATWPCFHSNKRCNQMTGLPAKEFRNLKPRPAAGLAFTPISSCSTPDTRHRLRNLRASDTSLERHRPCSSQRHGSLVGRAGNGCPPGPGATSGTRGGRS
jgi:N-acyl-D-amino-acid deacylase